MFKLVQLGPHHSMPILSASGYLPTLGVNLTISQYNLLIYIALFNRVQTTTKPIVLEELSLDEQFVTNFTKLKISYFELPKSALNGSSIFFLGFSPGPASCFLGSAALLPLSSSRFIPLDRELNMCSGQLGGQYESGSLKT